MSTRLSQLIIFRCDVCGLNKWVQEEDILVLENGVECCSKVCKDFATLGFTQGTVKVEEVPDDIDEKEVKEDKH